MDRNIDTAFKKRQAHELVNTYEFDKAIVLCKRLITMSPKLYDNHYFWARTRGDQEEYRLSELKFREVTILNPQNPLAFNNMGIALSKQGKYEQAISSYKKGLEISQNHLDMTYNIAIAYTKKGDYEEAVEWYEKALKLSPYDASTHNCIGYLYFLQGKFWEAISKFDNAIQNNPQYEMPYYNKAIALFCELGIGEEPNEAFRLGVKALSGGYNQKLHRLKASLNNYNSELNRVKKELDRPDLKSEARLNLEKIQKGFEFVLNGLAIEAEKFENLMSDISKKKAEKG